ncbi:MAG TPA: hypothetical protein H9779_05210 [Candidatus Alistipes avicola]|uniref:Uncharacterized protein n=1 Tax=Candidatus Alistipes avicola TaxID=2838432 RepID=A0A9D2L488_9BACT|nr:hypothetical protein [uncultured Alistipes sp.]HJA98980.1 hypothetical protein [Candidatus Alistipes avicola]
MKRIFYFLFCLTFVAASVASWSCTEEETQPEKPPTDTPDDPDDGDDPNPDPDPGSDFSGMLDRCGAALFFGGELDNYYLALANTETVFEDQMCVPAKEGVVLYLDLYSEKYSEPGNIRIKEGSYTMSIEPRAGSCVMEYTFALMRDASGQTTSIDFAVGTVDVLYEGDLCRIEATFTSAENVEYTFYYRGKLEFEDQTPPVEADDVLRENVDVELTSSLGHHYRDALLNPDADIVVLNFSDVALDDQGKLTEPGVLLTLQLNTEPVPDPEYPILFPGTYRVSADMGQGTLTPGVDYDLYVDGSFCAKASADGSTLYGLIAGGQVEIAQEGIWDYRVTVNLTTAEGVSVKGSYLGPIDLIADNTGTVDPDDNISKLESDYAVDLSSATVARAEYYGDYYFVGADYWKIRVEAETGDVMLFDLFSAPGDGTSLPAALYTPTMAYEEGSFMPGTLDFDNNPEGTWLLDARTGEATPLAPAMDGWVDVAVDSEGVYTFEFEFFDGAYPTVHAFTGRWSGTLQFENLSLFSMSGVKPASRTDASLMSPKVEYATLKSLVTAPVRKATVR